MCAFLSHVTVFPCLQQVFSPRRPWKQMWWSMTTWPLGCGESLGFCTATSLEWKEEEPRHLVTGTVSAWLETVCEVSHISQESNYISRERKSVKLVIWHDEKKVVYCLVIFFTSQLVIVTLTEARLAYTHTYMPLAVLTQAVSTAPEPTGEWLCRVQTSTNCASIVILSYCVTETSQKTTIGIFKGLKTLKVPFLSCHIPHLGNQWFHATRYYLFLGLGNKTKVRWKFRDNPSKSWWLNALLLNKIVEWMTSRIQTYESRLLDIMNLTPISRWGKRSPRKQGEVHRIA